MKKIMLFALVLLISISACKKKDKSEPYERFVGTYDLVSNGTLSLSGTDQDFNDEIGKVIIKKGDNSDEIFIYVETATVTDMAPLGVSANADVDGDNYEMEAKNISLNILGTAISFNVDAEGVLSNENKTLTSTVVFSGGVSGTITTVGTKK